MTQSADGCVEPRVDIVGRTGFTLNVNLAAHSREWRACDTTVNAEVKLPGKEQAERAEHRVELVVSSGWLDYFTYG